MIVVFRNHPSVKWFIKYRVSVALLLCFFLALALRLYHLDSESIWMDEDRQASIAGKGFNLGMVTRAAGQHQPPIDYYLEAIGLSIFGKTEIGARIHAAFMGSISILLFILLLRLNLRGNRFVYLTVCLFIIDAFHIRYSQEGRPIATGVFASLLYVIAVFNFITEHHLRSRVIKNLILLFIANVILMLSVGFQPIVFLFASSAALIPGLFIRSMNRGVLITWLIALVSGLLSYPIISLGISEAGPYVGEKSLIDRFVALIDAISTIDSATWLKKIDSIFGNYKLIAILLLIPGMWGLVRYWAERRNDGIMLFSAYTMLLVFFYPMAFDILFNSQISYNMKPRYYATYQPALFTALSVLIFHSFGWLKSFSPVIAKWGTRLLCSALAFLFVLSLVDNGAVLKKRYTSSHKTGWRQLYSLLNEVGKAGDAAYMMNLTSFGKWKPYFHATRFYYKKIKERPVALKRSKWLLEDYEKDKLQGMSNLFIVIAYGYEHIRTADFSKHENISLYRFPRMSVVRVTNIERTRDLKDSFRVITDNLKQIPENYRAFYMLARMMVLDGNTQEADIVIEKLSELDRSPKFKEGVIEKITEPANSKN